MMGSNDAVQGDLSGTLAGGDQNSFLKSHRSRYKKILRILKMNLDLNPNDTYFVIQSIINKYINVKNKIDI